MSWMFTKTYVDLNTEIVLKYTNARFWVGFKLTERQARRQSTTVNVKRILHDFISIMIA